MDAEEILKDYICSRYKSVRQFCIENNLKYSTVVAMLSRGMRNSSIDTVFDVCKALHISVEPLIKNGEIVRVFDDSLQLKHYNLEHYFKFIKLAAFGGQMTLDGSEITPLETTALDNYLDVVIELLRKNRKRE